MTMNESFMILTFLAISFSAGAQVIERPDSSVPEVTCASDGTVYHEWEDQHVLQRHRLPCAAGCSHRLDIQSVPQGYYFVKVQSPTSIAIRKLVVK